MSLWSSSDSSVVDDDWVLPLTWLIEIESSIVGWGEIMPSFKEGEGITNSSVQCSSTESCDDKKGQSCLVGVGNVLLKLSNMEEVVGSWGEVGSNMISSELLQVWWS